MGESKYMGREDVGYFAPTSQLPCGYTPHTQKHGRESLAGLHATRESSPGGLSSQAPFTPPHIGKSGREALVGFHTTQESSLCPRASHPGLPSPTLAMTAPMALPILCHCLFQKKDYIDQCIISIVQAMLFPGFNSETEIFKTSVCIMEALGPWAYGYRLSLDTICLKQTCSFSHNIIETILEPKEKKCHGRKQILLWDFVGLNVIKDHSGIASITYKHQIVEETAEGYIIH